MTKPFQRHSSLRRWFFGAFVFFGVFSSRFLDAYQTEEDALVTINVRDESLANLLEALSVQHGLNLLAGDDVEGDITLNLYDVPLHQALQQILATQGYGYVKEGEFYRIVEREELDRIAQAADLFSTRIFTLKHLTAAEAAELLTPLISEQGQLNHVEEDADATTDTEASGTGRPEHLVVRERLSALLAIEELLNQIDIPPSQVLLEATILSINLGDDSRWGLDFNVLGGIDFNGASGVSDLTGLNGYDLSGSLLDDLVFSGQTFGFTSDPPGRGLSIGLVKNQVAVFLEALEETTNATILSNPKVVSLNGQVAEIVVGGRLGYVTVVSTENTAFEEVQFLDTGTQLRFTPHITEDGWVRMFVHPQNSSGVIDPVSGIPSESTSEITTSVLLRDGQTMVIGGLINETIQNVRSQIPWLGSLPFIGGLFGRTVETIERREIVILLTPHILDPLEEEARAEEVRRVWDAVHRSHMDSLSPHLRPKMAQALHADGEVLRVQGDLDGALGAVERALQLNPTSVPAAMLREKLLRELALEQLPLDEELLSIQALDGLDRVTKDSEEKALEEDQ